MSSIPSRPGFYYAIATSSLGQIEEIELPLSPPAPGQVLMKVFYGAMIPLDAYMVDLGYFVNEYPVVLGYSAAGTVEMLGEGVDDLKIGDKVTAFAFTPGSKALQRYCVQPRNLCAKVPDDYPLDQAAAIPDNFVAAFYSVVNGLSLSFPPTFPSTAPIPENTTPVLVYGAGSTAAQYVIQLLRIAGYTNVIATASVKNHEYVKSLGATHVFDYNDPKHTEEIVNAAGGNKVSVVFDPIATQSTMKAVAEVVAEDATVAILLPKKKGSTTIYVSSAGDMEMELPKGEENPFGPGVKLVGVRTFLFQEDENLKNNLMPKILPQLLESGLLKPNRVKLLDTGSVKERVLEGLELLRGNTVSGEKVIIKID
ncbi:GroES-like protein [Pluteus cervinus]|uniref:GroES-like protein n=1 Tax=Pluteus cervinus TaxID=181527 RepID=A0ACD3ATJ7_9AGAR|nr:GroES-like protein [Pluteus cervinus]